MQAGDVLAGKYRVERVLGVGGMGVVVSAIHMQLAQRVALKFLLGDMARKRDVVARFLREAQAAVRIQSEHVARVTDVGTLPNGAPYLVMEFLSGRDLADLLEKKGPLPVAMVADYVLQACEAIAEAHALGIVHRDLKPANLFLTRRADGSALVKVIDFGISKSTLGAPTPAGASLTATAGLLGSPYYVSPEQVKSAKHVDARTDIWALGIIVHELLTGKPPFVAEHLYGLLSAIDRDPPPPLRSFRADVPAAIEAAVLRCLEKEPALRWHSVAAFAEALVPFAPPSGRISFDRISRLAMGTAGGVTGVPISSDGEGPTVVMMPSIEMDEAMGKPGPQAAEPVRHVAPLEDIAIAPTMEAGHLSMSDLRPTSVVKAATETDIPGGTAGSWGQTRSERAATTTRRNGWLLGGAVVMVAVMVATWALVATTFRSGAAPKQDTPPTATASSSGSGGSGGSIPSASTTPPPPTTLPPPTTSPPPPFLPPPPRPTASALPKPKCDPPYVIDKAGNTRYKPECL